MLRTLAASAARLSAAAAPPATRQLHSKTLGPKSSPHGVPKSRRGYSTALEAETAPKLTWQQVAASAGLALAAYQGQGVADVPAMSSARVFNARFVESYVASGIV